MFCVDGLFFFFSSASSLRCSSREIIPLHRRNVAARTVYEANLMSTSCKPFAVVP